VEGTDAVPPALSQENELSKILYDAEISPEVFQKSLSDKSRRQPKYENGDVVAENVLVDYKDNKDSKETIIKKLFGHAVYTNKDKMLFNTDLIVNEQYKN